MRPNAIKRATGAVLLALAAAGCATVAISDRDFGLAKGGVFDVTRSEPFTFAGESAAKLPRPHPGSGEPPMITHAVDEFLPLTLARNGCLACHDRPAAIGKPVAQGRARPAPASHYQTVAAGALQLDGAKFNCMACHAPQAGVAPLVAHTAR